LIDLEGCLYGGAFLGVSFNGVLLFEQSSFYAFGLFCLGFLIALRPLSLDMEYPQNIPRG
jgi:hypothetical protein